MSLGSLQGEQRTSGNNGHITTCNYCQREGHWKDESPLLKSKKGFSTWPAKSAGLAVPLSSSRSSTDKIVSPYQMQTKMLCTAEIASRYVPFISDGFVSLVDSSEKVPVKMLRFCGIIPSSGSRSCISLQTRTQGVVFQSEEWD